MSAPGIIYKKFSMAFRLAFSALAILLAGFILVQSLTEAHSSITVSNMDKVVHLGAYFVLGAATLPALPRLKPILVWALLSLFGGGIEIAQGMMNLGRSASFFDGLANASGALLAVLFWLGLTWTLSSFRQRREKSAT